MEADLTPGRYRQMTGRREEESEVRKPTLRGQRSRGGQTEVKGHVQLLQRSEVELGHEGDGSQNGRQRPEVEAR